jgi:hypothetical protein
MFKKFVHENAMKHEKRRPPGFFDTPGTPLKGYGQNPKDPRPLPPPPN